MQHEEILRLKAEKNAVILAHYYQDGEIQDLADFVGDSLELARAAQKTTAELIVFAGPLHGRGCKNFKPVAQSRHAGSSRRLLAFG